MQLESRQREARLSSASPYGLTSATAHGPISSLLKAICRAGLALGLLIGHPSSAIQVKPLTLEETVASANGVIVGRVVERQSRWRDFARKWMVTDYVVEVDEVLIPSEAIGSQTRIRLTYPGGSVDGEIHWVPGLVQPEVGGRYIFALGERWNEPGYEAVVAAHMGLFRLEGAPGSELEAVLDHAGRSVSIASDGALVWQNGPAADPVFRTTLNRLRDALRERQAQLLALARARRTVATASSPASEEKTSTLPGSRERAFEPGPPPASACSSGAFTLPPEQPRATDSSSPLAERFPSPSSSRSALFVTSTRGPYPGNYIPFRGLPASFNIPIDLDAMARWNYYAPVFSGYPNPTNTVAWGNGINEFYGWFTDAQRNAIWGDHWPSGGLGVTQCAASLISFSYECDVMLNDDQPWVLNDYSSLYYGYGNFNANVTIFHELGHVLGLDHENSGVPSVMTSFYGADGLGDYSFPRPDDTAGIRALYPSATVGRSDYELLASPYNWSYGIPYTLQPGDTIAIDLGSVSIGNVGTTSDAQVSVDWYISSYPGLFDYYSTLLGSQTLTNLPGSGGVSAVGGVMAFTPPPLGWGEYWVFGHVREAGAAQAAAGAATFPWDNNFTFSPHTTVVPAANAVLTSGVTVQAGCHASLTLTTTNTARVGGVTLIPVSSNAGALQVPASVAFQNGATSATVSIVAGNVTTPTDAQVSLTMNTVVGPMTVATTTVSVMPSTLSVGSISPLSGPSSGGTRVEIRGGPWGGEKPSVTFDGVPSLYTSFIGTDTSRIVAVAPPHAPGAVTVQVGACSIPTATAAQNFTYVADDPCRYPSLRQSSVTPVFQAPSSRDVVSGDFDGDGRSDLAMSDFVENKIHVFRSNGDGTFIETAVLGVVSPATRLLAADMDGDGRCDIVAALSNGSIVIFYFTGSGITASVMALPIEERYSIVAGDFNQDGWMDLAWSGPSGISIAYLNGGLQYSSVATFPLVNAGPLVTAEVNGDGLIDLVMPAGDAGNRGIWVWLGGLDGFTGAPSREWAGNVFWAAAGDVNGDGRSDLVFTDGFNVYLALGKADGHLAPATALPVWADPVRTALLDVNGDGALDLLVASSEALRGTGYQDEVQILLGNGMGGFTAPVSLPVDAFLWNIVIGDFSGDGKTDFAIRSTGAFAGDKVATYLSNPETSPAAAVVSNSGPVCEGGGLQLTVGNPGAGASFRWRGPNSFSSSDQNPILAGVARLATGVYGVEVIVGGCVVAEGTTAVTVQAAPGLVVINTPSFPLKPGEASLAVIFSTRRGTTYTWWITNGTITSGQGTNQIHYKAGTAGTLTLSVTATNSPACGQTFAQAMVRVRSTASGDFDGDGKTDVSVFRPSTGTWWTHRSSDGAVMAQQWGLSTDIPVPGDYDGDGKTDIAVFRPSSGTWWILRSSDGTVVAQQWGLSNDIPVAADYDGDGKADIAVYRPSTGTWWILNSRDGTIVARQWGLSTDIAVAADYDGDGKADIAVYRPSTGTWWILRSSDGTVVAQQWGLPTDVPVPADYDGDGKVDIAVYRPGTGIWWILNSSDGTITAVPWGLPTDTPVTARTR